MTPSLTYFQQKLHAALPSLKVRYPIEKMALFGSVTRDDFDPEKSDIDILVELNGSIGYSFCTLAEELETLLGKKVDLVSKNGLNKPWWREHILKQAVYV
jgi:predicted nucleotidyltransferase